MEHGGLVLGKEEESMDLPPGFRFHPTDEELITHYLCNKVMDSGFSARAIGDVDLNKCEPWDLPWRAKMGEKEWYFFCLRDRKYPTGLRTNRATEAGYWKATGKDKDIHRGKNLVGMKKTLVFYRGRAPKGEKSNWVMHEYRLEGKNFLPKTTKNEWVICRVFNKSSCGKKLMPLLRTASGEELGPSLLPPLMDAANHVTCFSNPMEDQKGNEELLAEYYNPQFLSASNPSEVSPSQFMPSKMPLQGAFYTGQVTGGLRNMQFQTASLVQLLESNGFGMMKQRLKTEREMLSVSQDTGLTCDMNTEISSVFSNNEMRRQSLTAKRVHPLLVELCILMIVSGATDESVRENINYVCII